MKPAMSTSQQGAREAMCQRASNEPGNLWAGNELGRQQGASNEAGIPSVSDEPGGLQGAKK